MAGPVKRLVQSGFERIGLLLERVLGGEGNPLAYLGALTIFLFWIVLVSGVWLFLFFRTSIDGAYDSVEYLTHGQWYFGGVMRSLHRYASDAAVVTLVLHIVHEWAGDRYRGKQWFSWITGLPLLWIVIPLGITGYWLVWDSLAQYVALTSAELLDWLPIFTDSMARNFLLAESVSNRFFTLMAFLHVIGLPLFLVFAIWLHVFRISQPSINPPRTLMAVSLLGLLALSIAFPALSQGRADLSEVPQSLGLDWYYLAAYPLTQAWSPGAVWALLAGCSLLLFIAPWLPPRRTPPVARVDLDNCNGCRRCADDCPYGAVTMQPRTDGSRYEVEAVVDPALCVSCGICVGACPTAMPFRKASALSPGIDLPDISALMLREELEQLASGLEGTGRVIVIGCDGSGQLKDLADSATAVLMPRCAGHIPPAYVDYILSRDLADGVLFAGCADGTCRYRLGQQWTEARIGRERDPHLRARVDSRRVGMAWEVASAPARTPAQALAELRGRLSALQADQAPAPRPPARGWVRITARGLGAALFAVAAGAFSSWPVFELLGPEESVLSLSFSHAGQRVSECRRLTQDELNDLPPNMRKPMDCPRERRPLRVELRADGEVLYQRTLEASGLWSDGESTVYARFTLPAGTHRMFVGMADSGRETGFDYRHERAVTLRPGQHVVIDFDPANDRFRIREE
ncbi:4Fe-4S binding protein [Elongatibacter sediminis]|uniref:Cytochrome b N-terminal domain-containing protein n=1 Tax=Elongatibacter sediminis TaxID=3119006 RepID=A0AAW9RB84_9GAMM